jgi:hypothetical protein
MAFENLRDPEDVTAEEIARAIKELRAAMKARKLSFPAAKRILSILRAHPLALKQSIYPVVPKAATRQLGNKALQTMGHERLPAVPSPRRKEPNRLKTSFVISLFVILLGVVYRYAGLEWRVASNAENLQEIKDSMVLLSTQLNTIDGRLVRVEEQTVTRERPANNLGKYGRSKKGAAATVKKIRETES